MGSSVALVVLHKQGEVSSRYMELVRKSIAAPILEITAPYSIMSPSVQDMEEHPHWEIMSTLGLVPSSSVA